jgi:hypothetical protein
MLKTVQDILYLFHTDASLESQVIGWSRFFASVPGPIEIVDEEEPPYTSVLNAMRDGWQVLQVPELKEPPKGQEYEVGYLSYQTVLQRMTDVS